MKTKLPQLPKLFTLANKERELIKVPSLKFDDQLAKLAVTRAKELYDKKQWSHDNWEKSFTTTNCGNRKGENLAKDFKSDDDAHKALMASASHKKNLLNKEFTHVGVGSYKNINVELFCKKK